MDDRPRSRRRAGRETREGLSRWQSVAPRPARERTAALSRRPTPRTRRKSREEGSGSAMGLCVRGRPSAVAGELCPPAQAVKIARVAGPTGTGAFLPNHESGTHGDHCRARARAQAARGVLRATTYHIPRSGHPFSSGSSRWRSADTMAMTFAQPMMTSSPTYSLTGSANTAISLHRTEVSRTPIWGTASRAASIHRALSRLCDEHHVPPRRRGSRRPRGHGHRHSRRLRHPALRACHEQRAGGRGGEDDLHYFRREIAAAAQGRSKSRSSNFLTTLKSVTLGSK